MYNSDFKVVEFDHFKNIGYETYQLIFSSHHESLIRLYTLQDQNRGKELIMNKREKLPIDFVFGTPIKQEIRRFPVDTTASIYRVDCIIFVSNNTFKTIRLCDIFRLLQRFYK